MYAYMVDEALAASGKSDTWRDLMNFHEELTDAQGKLVQKKPITRTKLRGVIGLLKQAGVICSVRDTDTERATQLRFAN